MAMFLSAKFGKALQIFHEYLINIFHIIWLMAILLSAYSGEKLSYPQLHSLMFHLLSFIFYGFSRKSPHLQAEAFACHQVHPPSLSSGTLKGNIIVKNQDTIKIEVLPGEVREVWVSGAGYQGAAQGFKLSHPVFNIYISSNIPFL